MRNRQRDGCLAHAAMPNDGDETLGDEFFADEPDGVVAPADVRQSLGEMMDRCVEWRFEIRSGAFVPTGALKQ